MERKLVLTTGVVILFTSLFCVALRLEKVQASGTIYIRADGSIEPPTANITTVDNITYTFIGNINESIVVERTNIVVDGAGYTLQGSGSGDGFYWSGINNVTIQNTNIKNFTYGIYLASSSNNSISGNNIANNGDGIHLSSSSNYNTILGNTITNNGDGIYLSMSSGNFLRDNVMAGNLRNFGLYGSVMSDFVNDVDTSNTVDGKPVYYWVGKHDAAVPLEAGYVALVNCTNIRVENLTLTKNHQGILLAYTDHSTIIRNTITNNEYGIGLVSSLNNAIQGNNITANSWYGIYLSSSSNNTISANTITDNGFGPEDAGIHLSSSSNNTISANNITNNVDYGILIRFSSNNNTISGNSITENHVGIFHYESSGGTIFGNNIMANNLGIGFGESSNNIVFRNNITANVMFGIWIADSSNNNTVYHNNFINTQQVLVTYSANNTWDNGCEGNYWSTYAGSDSDGDGIGDTPYVIDGENQDNYPLMNPYWNPSDINHDLIVDIFDVVRAAGAYDSTPSDLNWNPHCDIAEPYGVIDIFDIVTIAMSYGEEYIP